MRSRSLFIVVLLLTTSFSTTRSTLITLPADIVGLWRLASPQPPNAPVECPTNITHVSKSRFRGGPFRLPHTSILHESIQCSDLSEPPRERRFRFYTRTAVYRKLKIPQSTFRVPDLLLRLLNTTSPVRKIQARAERVGGDYFVGFEAVDRVCNGTVVFGRGTVAYVLRPVGRTFMVRSIGLRLTPAARWLVMIPFRQKPCVYIKSPVAENETSSEPSEEPQNAEEGDAGGASSENDLEGSRGSERECFPGDALVGTEDGELREMSALKVGDRVAVGDGMFSEVFMFTHKDKSVRAEFIRIVTETGERVSLTAGHYLYVNGELQLAARVRAGDSVELPNGSKSGVVAVRRVVGGGLYNPQTLQGDIIVNGVRVSTYTRAVEPRFAHVVLSPLRGLYRISRRDWSFGTFGQGVPWSAPASKIARILDIVI